MRRVEEVKKLVIIPFNIPDCHIYWHGFLVVVRYFQVFGIAEAAKPSRFEAVL